MTFEVDIATRVGGARRRFDVLPWTIRVRDDVPGFVLRTSTGGKARD